MSATQPYEELSYRDQIERLRQLAKVALGAYDLADEQLTLLMHTVNSTFRVDGRSPAAVRSVLRIYRPEIYPEKTIRSELRWLRALKRDLKLGVPEPVPAADGSLITEAETAGVPGARCCVLFRWVDGEFRDSTLTPEAVGRVGEFMARMHRYNERFVVPEFFERPRYDLRGLIGDSEVIPPGKGDGFISGRDRPMLDEAAKRIREEVAELGAGSEVFGLIHGDLTQKNYLFHGEEVRAIDFTDFGWGYFLYDVVTALLRLADRKDYPALEKAFFLGYHRIRPLPEKHLRHLEAFMAARVIYLMRFFVRHWEIHLENPIFQERATEGLQFLKSQVRRFLDRRLRNQVALADEPQDVTLMTTVDFLSHLHSRDVKLWADGDRLRFNAPEGALTPELRTELVKRKPEVLAFLRQTATAAASESPPIEAGSGAGTFPVSFAQERLWFFDQWEPQSAVYNISQAVRLEVALRAAVLRRSLDEIIRRHAVLRTTFAAVEGRPVLVVAAAGTLTVPVVDLRRLPEAEREPHARRLVRHAARQPFDLGCGPLLRVVILSLDPADHILLLTIHHIVCDGWSNGLLIRELLTLYQAFSRGEPCPLPELPIQYADFAQWQRQWLRGRVLDEQLSYWKQQLAGAPDLLHLPTDRPRSSLQSFTGDKRTRWLSRELSEELKALAQRRGVTLFMTLLAAFNALLCRWTGQDDVVVGCPIANRNRAEIEELIGFFANTLVLRSQLARDPTFRELLE